MYGPVSGSTTIASSGADLTGTTSYSYFGWSLAGGADVNGDGADDMVVGTYNPGDHGVPLLRADHGGRDDGHGRRDPHRDVRRTTTSAPVSTCRATTTGTATARRS